MYITVKITFLVLLSRMTYQAYEFWSKPATLENMSVRASCMIKTP